MERTTGSPGSASTPRTCGEAMRSSTGRRALDHNPSGVRPLEPWPRARRGRPCQPASPGDGRQVGRLEPATRARWRGEAPRRPLLPSTAPRLPARLCASSSADRAIERRRPAPMPRRLARTAAIASERRESRRRRRPCERVGRYDTNPPTHPRHGRFAIDTEPVVPSRRDPEMHLPGCFSYVGRRPRRRTCRCRGTSCDVAKRASRMPSRSWRRIGLRLVTELPRAPLLRFGRRQAVQHSRHVSMT